MSGQCPLPKYQERHHDYVLGPNQDARLASVAAGAEITNIELQLDPDAPFELRSRCVRQAYTQSLTQNGLQFLKTKWTGPLRGVFRQQDYVLESLQMAYFGQVGNPKPIRPSITYPANGILSLNLINTGASALTNVTFFWRGVKLFPWGAVPAYRYPAAMKSSPFSYPVPILNLGPAERRTSLIFQPGMNNATGAAKPDSDFVLRAGQATPPFGSGEGDARRQFAEIGIRLYDWSKKPFSNDFVPLDILFGGGSFPAAFPLGQTPSFISPFGTGPAQPGLFYPEIYIPRLNQLLYDLQRTDGAINGNVNESFVINWIGQKVFPQ